MKCTIALCLGNSNGYRCEDIRLVAAAFAFSCVLLCFGSGFVSGNNGQRMAADRELRKRVTEEDEL